MVKKETQAAEEKQEKATGVAAVAVEKVPKKKGKKTLSEGVFYIHAGINNTIISLADKTGRVVASSSAGQVGFKGTRKATPFAASQAARAILEKARHLGVGSAEIVVKGVGVGRESAIRTIGNSEIEITVLRDVTPVPHNGPRPKRARRV